MKINNKRGLHRKSCGFSVQKQVNTKKKKKKKENEQTRSSPQISGVMVSHHMNVVSLQIMSPQNGVTHGGPPPAPPPSPLATPLVTLFTLNIMLIIVTLALAMSANPIPLSDHNNEARDLQVRSGKGTDSSLQRLRFGSLPLQIPQVRVGSCVYQIVLCFSTICIRPVKKRFKIRTKPSQGFHFFNPQVKVFAELSKGHDWGEAFRSKPEWPIWG